MGCGGSKLDDSEAIVLCRERSSFLAEAISYRYSLADAHTRYCKSLMSVGEALARFLDGIQIVPPQSSEVVLQLPAQRKGEGFGQQSHSSSGHIDFHDSDSDIDSDDDADDEVYHHLHGGDEHIVHYAKKKPTNSSVIYEQKPKSPENGTVYFNYGGMGEASTSSSYYNPYNYGYPQSYGNFYGDMGGVGGGGGYFGSGSPPPSMMQQATPKAPPPPPSPPRASTWDFLNPFENYENYYAANYTPSRSSKDVREEEGIPELEDEENVVVKEAYKEKKIVESASSSPGSSKGDSISEVEEEIPQLKRKSVEASTSEVNASNEVEKNVVVNEVKETKRYNSLSEVVQEIKSQFDRAANSAVELSKILEVGKQPYHQRNSVYKVSARMICGAGTLPSLKDDDLLVLDDKDMGSGNLSSTLRKLYIWEKKLYDEVMAEEKMRLVHDRKCRKMKRLDERGAEALKLDATLAIVRKLSTKIKIAIQVVDSISNKINKLRDDELWPQISDLIQGLMRMWNAMLECHRTQYQALLDAKNLDSLTSTGTISDTHMEVTKQLEFELLEWITNFSSWTNAQKDFVIALNNWLMKGLRYVQEETPDGIAPFSPGRLGAPPVFVICHQWAQTMERISEKEVIDSMRAFAYTVQQLWEKHNFEQRQRLMANKDMDRTLRIMEREEQEMRRAVEAQNKKLFVVSGHNSLAMSKHNEASNLKVGLRRIFEAMDNFSSNTLKAYEELQIRVEEERLARENERVT